MERMKRLLKKLSPANAGSKISPKEVAKELKSDRAIGEVVKCAVSWKGAPTKRAIAAIAALRLVRSDPRLPGLLMGRLASRSAEIRYGAAYALKNVPHGTALEVLRIRVLKDKNENVRICCLHALLALALTNKKLNSVVADLCAIATAHESHGVRHAGFECLSHLSGTGHKSIMKAASSDPNELIANSADAWMDTYLGR